MSMPLAQRLRAAIGIVLRGSVAPFDRILSSDGAHAPGTLRRPYAESVWAYAAIQRIARPCSAVRLEHSAAPRQRRGPRVSALEDPRLEAFWSSPAIGLTSLSEFILATIGWRKLAGEAFWILGDDAAMPFPEVRESWEPLILARPDRMRHVVVDGRLIGWEFTDGGGRRHALAPEQVVHLRQWNPYDDHRGLGEWEVARIAAETDRASGQFSRNLAASQGDQGPYVVAKGGVLDETQRRQIQSLLEEKRRLQQRGIFRPMFLTGDITVEDPKLRTVDAAFLEGRRMSAAEIFVAFGVPPSMAKEQASYSIGSASDYFRLILDTCMPEAAAIAEGVARVSSLLIGRKVWSWFCWDDHPVLQEVRKERMATMDGLWAKGMPVAAISEYLDLDLPRFEGDDHGWLPISVVPAAEAASLTALTDPGQEGDVDSGTTAADAPPEGGTPAADPVQAAMRALQTGRTRARDPRELAEWRRHMRQRVETARGYQSAFTRVLAKARALVLAKLAALGPRAARGPDAAATTPPSEKTGGNARQCAGNGRAAVRAGAIDLMWDPQEFLEGLIQGHRRVSEGALARAARQVWEELGRDDPMTYPPESVLQFLRARENRLKDVAQGTFDAIRTQIEEGLESGETMDQLADRVRAAFNTESRSRAKRIAMTETAAAYGVGRQDGMRQAGVRYKRWLTSGGDNVRPAHMEANNQTVRVDEPFDVGGEQLMHPGDPNGGPANVINCHCVAVAVADPDEGLNP